MSDNELIEEMENDSTQLTEFDFDWIYTGDDEFNDINSISTRKAERPAWRRIEEYLEIKELREQIVDPVVQ